MQSMRTATNNLVTLYGAYSLVYMTQESISRELTVFHIPGGGGG